MPHVPAWLSRPRECIDAVFAEALAAGVDVDLTSFLADINLDEVRGNLLAMWVADIVRNVQI